MLLSVQSWTFKAFIPRPLDVLPGWGSPFPARLMPHGSCQSHVRAELGGGTQPAPASLHCHSTGHSGLPEAKPHSGLLPLAAAGSGSSTQFTDLFLWTISSDFPSQEI